MTIDREGPSSWLGSLTISRLLLVFVGGAIGTLARALAGELAGTEHLTVATFGVNMLGAFGLGVLLEALARDSSETGRAHRLRLLLGAGFFGGFTTYSALALIIAELTRDGQVLAALGYGLATVIVGVLATLLGVLLGAVLGKYRLGDVPPARGEAA